MVNPDYGVSGPFRFWLVSSFDAVNRSKPDGKTFYGSDVGLNMNARFEFAQTLLPV
jgi:hypothetical protein